MLAVADKSICKVTAFSSFVVELEQRMSALIFNLLPSPPTMKPCLESNLTGLADYSSMSILMDNLTF